MDQREDEIENAELVLFQVKECYVYMIPPRKSSASYRADEWNVNKWAWEGALKVVSKGEDCIIRLEDKDSGELYAQSPLRKGEQLPVERVIDSSRYFVLRIEDMSSGKPRHAFIGIGFRERVAAYDFEAAVYDHVKYLEKKKQAEELEKEFQTKASVDYSLKDGQKIHLSLKSPNSGSRLKSKLVDSTKDLASVPALAPPPSTSLSFDGTTVEQSEEDEEFGDFQDA